MSDWKPDPTRPGFAVRHHPRRGPEHVRLADDDRRARARALLARLPADLALPVPAKGDGDRAHWEIPQEFWGCTREELRELADHGIPPFE